MYDEKVEEKSLAIANSKIFGLTWAGFLMFMIPILLGQSQIVLGSIINCLLILGAIYIKDYKKLIPLAMVPSLGSISRGLLLGSFTFFIIYMTPFIWMGNIALVLGIKQFFIKNKNSYPIALGLSVALKVFIIYCAARLLISFKVIPLPLLGAMGVIQIYTALIGGVMAYGVMKKFHKVLVNLDNFI